MKLTDLLNFYVQKLHEACSRGDLKLEDTTVDEDDTKMPPTADEIDNGEEDDEESINGEDSDILFLQQAIKENASDQVEILHPNVSESKIFKNSNKILFFKKKFQFLKSIWP